MHEEVNHSVGKRNYFPLFKFINSGLILVIWKKRVKSRFIAQLPYIFVNIHLAILIFTERIKYSTNRYILVRIFSTAVCPKIVTWPKFPTYMTWWWMKFIKVLKLRSYLPIVKLCLYKTITEYHFACVLYAYFRK
jgi:hypothetical protein